MLSSSQTSSLENFMWGCFGAATGSFSATIKDMKTAFFDQKPEPLDWTQVVEIVFFFVAAALFATLLFICRRSNRERDKLKNNIRDRTIKL